MKLAILWLFLVAGALTIIAAVASYDAAHTDPSIVVVGERNEIAALDLPLLVDATFVTGLDEIPAPIPRVLLLTPSAASSLPDGSLLVMAKKGVAIGGLNVPIEEIARLNGTIAERRLADEAFAEAGVERPVTPEPPFWSLLWRSCGIIADRNFDPGGTMGAGGVSTVPKVIAHSSWLSPS